MKLNEEHKLIVLFDGYCNLCQSSVQFILKHEKKQELYFASLQSEIGIQLLKNYFIDPTKINSIVFIQNNKAYQKSTAALKLTLYLKGLYPLGYLLLIIPPFIRNGVYNYISKNRYKWFGKTDSCMVPSQSLLNRFLK